MENITQLEEDIKQGRLIMKVPFFQVPNFVFDNENDLTEYELLVYIYLCRCGNQGADAFPSLPTIGSKTKTSRRTAARAIGGLIEKGYITKYPRTGTSNVYEIVYPGVVSDRHGVVPEGHGGVVSDRHPKKNPSFKKNQEGGRASSENSDNKNQDTISKALGYYRELYELKTDRQPNITDADIKALKNAVINCGLYSDDLKNCIRLLFESGDPYWKENAWPLKTFSSQINKFVVQLRECDEEEKQRERNRQILEQRRAEEAAQDDYIHDPKEIDKRYKEGKKRLKEMRGKIGSNINAVV